MALLDIANLRSKHALALIDRSAPVIGWAPVRPDGFAELKQGELVFLVAYEPGIVLIRDGRRAKELWRSRWAHITGHRVEPYVLGSTIGHLGGTATYYHFLIESTTRTVRLSTNLTTCDMLSDLFRQKAGTGASVARSADNSDSDLLRALQSLHEAGVLTDAEFRDKKAAVLARM